MTTIKSKAMQQNRTTDMPAVTNSGRRKDNGVLKVTPKSSEKVSKTLQTILGRWPTGSELLATFHVTYQAQIASNPFRCHFSNAPTLAQVTRLYGEGLTRGWLTAQLVNLSEFSGARDKINDMQLRELVQLIISDKYFLNMAEIMLFCHRFKTGRYEKLYGTVDPMAIMRSLREFLYERNDAFHEKEQKALDEKMRRDSLNAVSYREYLERKMKDECKTTD